MSKLRTLYICIKKSIHKENTPSIPRRWWNFHSSLLLTVCPRSSVSADVRLENVEKTARLENENSARVEANVGMCGASDDDDDDDDDDDNDDNLRSICGNCPDDNRNDDTRFDCDFTITTDFERNCRCD